MIVAVDFDGTIVEHDYPRIGAIKNGAIETLKRVKELGHTLVLWTVREDHHVSDKDYLYQAVELLRKHGIEVDGANKTPEQLDFRVEQNFPMRRKVLANVYIDDRNFGGFPGWDVILDYFEKLGPVAWV